MSVNSLPKTVTRQLCNCDLKPGIPHVSAAHYPLGYQVTIYDSAHSIQHQRKTLQIDMLTTEYARVYVHSGKWL